MSYVKSSSPRSQIQACRRGRSIYHINRSIPAAKSCFLNRQTQSYHKSYNSCSQIMGAEQVYSLYRINSCSQIMYAEQVSQSYPIDPLVYAVNPSMLKRALSASYKPSQFLQANLACWTGLLDHQNPVIPAAKTYMLNKYTQSIKILQFL